MRPILVFALLIAMFAAPVRADMAFLEVTESNINDLPFEFTFSRSFWSKALTVQVRPRQMNLDEIRSQVGGRLYHCQEARDHQDLNMNDMSPAQKDNSLIYKLRPNSTSRCFYFWVTDKRLPGGEVYWISVDSPLVRDPKHARH